MQGRETTLQFFGSPSGYPIVYALDCSRSTSPDNPHQVFADLSFNDKLAGMSFYVILQSRGKMEPKYYKSDMNARISRVEIQDGKVFLSYFVDTASEKLHFVWKKEEKEAIRLYQLEDTTKHIEYVQDGIIHYTGVVTPV